MARVSTSMLPSRFSSRGRASIDEPVIDVHALASDVDDTVIELDADR
jgi:hypothetical protein